MTPIRFSDHGLRTALIAASGTVREDYAELLPPRTCEAPDISYLHDAKMLVLMLNSAFVGMRHADPKAVALVGGLVRLVDKTVGAYAQGRSQLISFVESPKDRIHPWLRAVDHFETCVGSLRRSLLYAEGIQSLGKPEIRVRNSELPRDPERKRIVYFRGAIEHSNQSLQEGRMEEGAPPSLLVLSNKLVIRDIEIKFDELARWITTMNRLALRLSEAPMRSRIKTSS